MSLPHSEAPGRRGSDRLHGHPQAAEGGPWTRPLICGTNVSSLHRRCRVRWGREGKRNWRGLRLSKPEFHGQDPKSALLNPVGTIPSLLSIFLTFDVEEYPS